MRPRGCDRLIPFKTYSRSIAMARFTPEFLAAAQRRYEDTDDTLAAMAADFGVSERTINRMRDRGAWKRRSEREPRELSAVRLLDEATTLLASAPQAAAQPVPDAQHSLATSIERIEKLVQQELDAEEAVRTRLGRLPRPPADAVRVARTLATLTQTLHALQRLRCGTASGANTCGDDYDDMPEDIDAFRIALARRIDAFVESRVGPERVALDRQFEALTDDELKELAQVGRERNMHALLRPLEAKADDLD
jgi:transposase-like protein